MKKRTVVLAFIMICISFVALLITFGVVGNYGYSPAWTEIINGDQNLNDSAVAIAVHSDSRSIYVAGFKNKGGGQPGQPWVAKFMDSRRGPHPVWEQDFSGMISVDIIRIEDIAVNSENTYLYIIGTYVIYAGQSNVFIAQLSTEDGFIEWYATPDIHGFDDIGTGITVTTTEQGDVLYITGHASKGEREGRSHADRDIIVAKLVPPNIEPEWLQLYDDPPGPGVNANETMGGKVILHPNGSLYITACVRGFGLSDPIEKWLLLAKVSTENGNLTTLYSSLPEGAFHPENLDIYNTDITADNNGNLYIIATGNTLDFFIYNIDHPMRSWPRQTLNIRGQRSGRAGIVDLPDGGIACVSSVRETTPEHQRDRLDIFMATYPLGWSDRFGGDGMRDDYGNDIAVNTRGDIYVVGSVYSQFVNRKSDIWIRKYYKRSAIQARPRGTPVFSARRAS